MKCPCCAAKIGLFSPEMRTLGQTRACPHCGEAVTVGVLPLRFTLGFVPVAVLAIVLGVNGPISAGIAGGIGGAVGMGLKRIKR